jgi:hypothetical protein
VEVECTLRRIRFSVSKTTGDREHYLSSEDIRTVLRRLPLELWAKLRAIHFNDRSRGVRFTTCFFMNWGIFKLSKRMLSIHRDDTPRKEKRKTSRITGEGSYGRSRSNILSLSTIHPRRESLNYRYARPTRTGRSVLLGEQAVSKAAPQGSNLCTPALCRCGSIEKGSGPVNRLMLVRIQPSALFCQLSVIS